MSQFESQQQEAQSKYEQAMRKMAEKRKQMEDLPLDEIDAPSIKATIDLSTPIPEEDSPTEDPEEMKVKAQ